MPRGVIFPGRLAILTEKLPMRDIENWKAFAIILAPFLTVLTLLATLRLTKELKKTDLMMDCNRRFDQLTELAHEINQKIFERRLKDPGYAPSKQEQTEARYYFQRFFSLQFDQFNAYQQGVIDKKLFHYWMRSREREYVSSGVDVAGVTYPQAWDLLKNDKNWVNHPFLDFLNMVHDGDDLKAMKKHGPPFWRRLL